MAHPCNPSTWGAGSLRQEDCHEFEPDLLRLHRDQEEGYLHPGGHPLNCHILKTQHILLLSLLLRRCVGYVHARWEHLGLRRAEEAPAELFSDLLCGQEKADAHLGKPAEFPRERPV